MKLDQIWVYPVKSMVGGTVDSCVLNHLGIVGDREWAVRDLEHGGIRGAKKISGLMQLSARFTGDVDSTGPRAIEITLPDGSRVLSSAPDRDARISAAIGARVCLEHLQPAENLDHYRRGAPGSNDILRELRTVFGREESEPLPDFSVFPAEVVEFESPPGTYYDCWPLMVMSTAALHFLKTAVPDAVVDIRRFRPSLVIDVSETFDVSRTSDISKTNSHPEFAWAKRRATLGECELEFLDPCPRCVMVTHQVNADIPMDRTILRHIVRDLNQNLGIYARITRPGRIQVGDSLTLLD